MIRNRTRPILLPALALLWVMAIAPAAVSGTAAVAAALPQLALGVVYPVPGQHVADCADDDERYLTDDHSTGVRGDVPHRMFQHARYASHSDSFTYTFPVNPDSPGIWLAFEEEGECLVTVDGMTVVDEAGAGYGYLTPRQFRLTDSRLWEDGEVAVTFRDSDPEDGLGASILWIECGTSTRYRERVKHTEWGTTGIVWSLGLWDGTSHEFGGNRTDFRIGEVTAADIPGEGTVRIRWRQEVDPEKHYFLILGYLRGSGSIDMGDDGFLEITSEIEGEEALDLDVTNMLNPTDNVVSLHTPGGIDFIALVETTPGSYGPAEMRLSFSGTPDAENYSRVVENTWFWILGMHFDWTGFIDASPINGHWFQQYWPVDQATAFRELTYWGYTRQAKATAKLVADVSWRGHPSNRSGGYDNTAGNMIVIDMVSLLERTDYDPSLLKALWTPIREHCEEVVREAETSPFGLIKGRNWENAGNHEYGPVYALSTNSGAWFALRKAAGLADRLGEDALASEWRKRSAQIRESILANLVYETDVPITDDVSFPTGTWKYGLKDNGEPLEVPLAGWLWGANFGTGLYGLVDPDREFREIDTRTLEFAYRLLRMPNRPRVAGYSESLDGQDSMIMAAVMGDRPGLIAPLVSDIMKGTDFREDVGAKVCELSRWALGSPGGTEDTNLVGAGFFLNTARLIAGVDDMLYEGRQLRVVPRLPWEWTGCRISGWPVRYRKDKGEAWTELSYRLRREDGSAEMEIRTTDPVEGLRVRLGPFPLDSKVAEVKTVSGQREIEEETSGEAVWAWVTVDTGPEGERVLVIVDL